ncbi:hypothetical protein VP01_850g1 [Puccinia sorghi]|uniref:Uncharacterized protein n=1 Tax=Puccinia sorghi TaxID=27349 RepID=A0A0L6U948_9BASI|nr:hypothetical protein VP01_850g1 [Puccinia sorghi]
MVINQGINKQAENNLADETNKPNQSPEKEIPNNTSKVKKEGINLLENQPLESSHAKWDHSTKLEEKSLDWDKEEKEKDRGFEITKLDGLALKENYDLITQCLVRGKSTEEIERLANLFK